MSEDVTPPSGNLAIFDLDHTLTKKGTWTRFVLTTVKTRPHLWLPIIFAMAKNQWLYKRGRAPRCGVKKAMMRISIVGWPKEKVEAYAKRFAAHEVASGLRPGAIEALAHHKAAGDTFMVASAAVDAVVRPICEGLGIEHYVATDMSYENGKLASEFGSENCYGREKLLRVKAYLAQNPHLKQNHTKVTMYSDSHSDLDVLLWADIGVAVDPSKQLKSLANQHGLEVVNWM